jgi:hypothetical protein
MIIFTYQIKTKTIMKRRSLKMAALAITVMVLGVTLINLLIQGVCYILLAMFKYPVNTLLIMVALMGVLFLVDKHYTKVKNK